MEQLPENTRAEVARIIETVADTQVFAYIPSHGGDGSVGGFMLYVTEFEDVALRLPWNAQVSEGTMRRVILAVAEAGFFSLPEKSSKERPNYRFGIYATAGQIQRWCTPAEAYAITRAIEKAIPLDNRAHRFLWRGFEMRPCGGLSLYASPDYVRIPGNVGGGFDMAVRLRNESTEDPHVAAQPITTMEPLIQAKRPYWVRFETLSPGGLPVCQPDIGPVRDLPHATQISLAPGEESKVYRQHVTVVGYATPVPTGRFLLRPYYEVTSKDRWYGPVVYEKKLWRQGTLRGSPFVLEIREQGKLHDAFEKNTRPVIVDGEDPPTLRLMPPKPENTSLSQWRGVLQKMRMSQLTADDNPWLLLRGEVLYRDSRIWIERVERSGGTITVVAHVARWEGRQEKWKLYRPFFGINLGTLPPGRYEAEWELKLFIFERFDEQGRPADLKEAGYEGARAETTFIIAPSPASVAAELRLLVREAIARGAADYGSRVQGQRPTGMHLSRMLRLTGQRADRNAFTSDHRFFERDTRRLATDRKTWALCAILDHPNVDAKTLAARALVDLADPVSVPVLLAAAKSNNYPVEGSESATMQHIYRRTLKRALEKITRLALTPRGLKVTTYPKPGKPKVIRSEDDPSHFSEYIDFKKVEDWLRASLLEGTR